MKTQDIEDKFREVFPLPVRPGEVVRMPRSLAKLSSEKLSDLMNRYTHWREYTEDLLIDTYAECASTKYEYDTAYFMKYKTSQGKNKEERDAIVHTDPEVMEKQQAMLRANLYYDMLTSKLQGLRDSIAIISREITRRGTVTI